MSIRINRDEALAAEARKQVIENDGDCPCALDREPNTKCMCKDFREKVEMGEPYICHCGLYIIERK